MTELKPEVKDYFKEQGSKGGKAVVKKYGSNYMSILSRKGVEARKKKKLLEQEKEDSEGVDK